MSFLRLPTRKSEAKESNDIFSLLQTDVNRLFNRFLKDDFLEENLSPKKAWNPSISLKETKDAFVLKADLPGVEKKDIHVSLDNNQLTIKGERKYEDKKDDEMHHWNEKFYGYFERSFTLPQNLVDKDKIGAEMKNGELILSLPKHAGAKSEQKQIEIK